MYNSKHNHLAFAAAFILFLFGTTLAFPPAGYSEGNDKEKVERKTLFGETDTLLEALRKDDAEILSPQNFAEGMKHYKKAEADFEKGKKPDNIRKRLAEAVKRFQKAREITHVAQVTFETARKAQSDARAANADELAAGQWSKAEKKFTEAVKKLESGNVNNAREKSNQAETLYREAELTAVKITWLSATWELMKQARQLKVKRRAPETLQTAQKFLADAEASLNKDRYDIDGATALVWEANVSARHAIYLSELINTSKKTKMSTEEMLLASEGPLLQITKPLEVDITFENGFTQTTQAILDSIRAYKTYKELSTQLIQRLGDKDLRIQTLQAETAILGKRIEELDAEKVALAEELSRQAEINERYAAVEKLFEPHEAKLVRESNRFTIHLIGLSFSNDAAIIETRFFKLLSRIEKAIDLYPGADVVVQGHTDAQEGGEGKSQLSAERAAAVREYLLATMEIDPASVKTMGLGEGKPIASNDTPEGRAKNRRIDVVVYPKSGAYNFTLSR